MVYVPRLDLVSRYGKAARPDRQANLASYRYIPGNTWVFLCYLAIPGMDPHGNIWTPFFPEGADVVHALRADVFLRGGNVVHVPDWHAAPKLERSCGEQIHPVKGSFLDWTAVPSTLKAKCP